MPWWTPSGIQGAPPLTPEERKSLIDEPPEPWKQWWFSHGSKTWMGVGLFILDVLAALTVAEGGSLLDLVAVVPLCLLLVYLNFLLWMYLWRIPTPDELRVGRVQRTVFRPFAVGRWTYEYPLWKEGRFTELAGTDEPVVNPREFT